MAKILEMNHISKSFGGAKALSDVHFEMEEGEVHALLGENGAGKSTLMNILSGVLTADSGKITFLGKEYTAPTIKEMEEAGLAFVHQELNVINDLSVADNIFLRNEIRNRFGLINEKEQIKKTKELFESLGVDMDPTAMVSTLKTSEKQLLEICKALYRDARLLILDEPLHGLDNANRQLVKDVIDTFMQRRNKTLIMVTHYENELPECIDHRLRLIRHI